MSESTPNINADRSATSRRKHGRAILALIGVLLVAHGISLWEGLFFDDHWHRERFREVGWTPSELLSAATVDLSGELNHLWWQDPSEPMVWRYARPVAMLIGKIEYVVAQGDPMVIHGFALFWHLLTAVMIYILALRTGLSVGWAFFAAAFFVIYPHHFFTLGWTAARNALLGGLFFAAAIVMYDVSADRREGLPQQNGRPWWVAGTVLLYVLALLSRETAIVLPLVLLVIDLSRGGWRQLRARLGTHGVVWGLTALFMIWRLTRFSVEAVPSIYLHKPDSLLDFAYLPWAGSKLLQLLFSLFFYTPMLMGLATYRGLTEGGMLVHLVMAIGVMFILLWYVLLSRSISKRWVWPVWCIAAFVPVVPVFAMPHFSYLPAIPFSIMVAVMISRLRPPRRTTLIVIVLILTVWSLGVYRLAWWGITRSEQLVYRDMIATTPEPPSPGSSIFTINLPIAAIYTPSAMREKWDNDDLAGYVLTFAPHPLVMQKPSIVRQLNDHELVISTDAPGYFSGLSGTMLLDGTRPSDPLVEGSVVEGDLFDAHILAVNPKGVTRIKFVFDKPLTSPDYYFYVSSPVCPAYRLTFESSASASQPATDSSDLFEQARSDNPSERARARIEIRDTAAPVAVAMASPMQEHLHLQSEKALDTVEQWWYRVDVPRRAKDIAQWRSDNRAMLQQRELYFKVMDTVRRVIRSDLLLTGQHENRTSDRRVPKTVDQQ